ncbi:GNAT family N-acetyltransferase [Megalodesulfovibrio gigas]|uniref:BioF2-like acetyltransferase domain-containing protein n=1 Tax=Megalodesulfovibrio gigas (strain ATCC 19364 / DSM 1382 / NCIMB 9332 / VKM B-1759) TaxID=1121448 RepID=T2GAZ6_MEGG1|nr:GNAT family N-acetyltransferase [Megalodesulfovibrio gigas]AGW13468.1 hypothetical protein DGI_1642 [Megalodesulfovibrio gigas DSM 1382 = ATCC 19364]
MIRVQHITSLDEFESLAQEWDRLVLASRFPTPMLLHDWASCWLRTVGKAYAPAVIAVWESDQLAAVAPLCRRRLHLGPVPALHELRTLGAAGVSGMYFDFPVHAQASKHARQALLQALHQMPQWHRLRLERMTPGSQLLDACQHGTLFGDTVTECRQDVPCPVLPLPDTMAELEAGMDPVFRAILRRKNLKIAPSRHAVAFVPAIPAETLDADLTRLFQVHTARWTHMGHAGEFANADRTQFFIDLAHRLHAKGWLRFSKLLLDGEGHCFVYGVQLGDQYFGLQTGISPEGLACHAGIYNMYQLMQHLLPTASRFHFMEGDESYKFKWGAMPQMSYTMQAWHGLRGRAVCRLRRMRQVVQAWRAQRAATVE